MKGTIIRIITCCSVAMFTATGTIWAFAEDTALQDISQSTLLNVLPGDGFDSKSNYVMAGKDCAWERQALVNKGKLIRTGEPIGTLFNRLVVDGYILNKNTSDTQQQSGTTENDKDSQIVTHHALWKKNRKTAEVETQSKTAFIMNQMRDTVGSVTKGTTYFVSFAEAYGFNIAIEVPEAPDEDEAVEYSKYLSSAAIEKLVRIYNCYYDAQGHPIAEPDIQEHLKIINEWETVYGDSFVSSVELKQIGLGVIASNLIQASKDESMGYGTTNQSANTQGGTDPNQSDTDATSDQTNNLLKQARQALNNGRGTKHLFALPIDGQCGVAVSNQIENVADNIDNSLLESEIPSSQIQSKVMAPENPQALTFNSSYTPPPPEQQYQGIQQQNDPNGQMKQEKQDNDEAADSSEEAEESGADLITNNPSAVQQVCDPENELKESDKAPEEGGELDEIGDVLACL